MSFKQSLRRCVLPLLSATLLSASVSAQAEPVLLDRIVAIVNDDVIMQSELDNRAAVIRAQLSANQTRLPSEEILNRQVLDRLIIDSIQLQIAQQQGLKISDRQLNETLEQVASRNGMTLAQFREALIAEGQDYNSAREQIRDELLLTQVQQSSVNRRIRVSEQEVQNFLASEQGKDAISPDYLLSNILIAIPEQATPTMLSNAERKALDIFQQLRKGADFAETAVANSNAQNALNGGDLGWRKASELPEVIATIAGTLAPGDFSKPVKTSSGYIIVQLRDTRGGQSALVEQTQVSHILLKPTEIRSEAQTRSRIEDLSVRLRNGEPFEQLARQYSDDSVSGSLGGDLGWTQDGQMVPEFEQVMKNTPNGQFSTPFESRFGWHILWVRDRRTQDMGDELRENRARFSIRQRKFNEELTTWLREIRAQAYVELKL
ncbi:peptidylprolyl isomerase [Marinobacterium sedimentorum]|uniref:peptidylprolyl isomerase n=1 Tax=Marinobacterium sedimentorum TaxID=2927804 RepID=UPI0020C6FF5F|nr:peptidylprolyl isomerase [Marinobacterium sedimentorum]MCP8689132.1 peptidylprolyl isomerase [Marinobacterium sedimentorum]